MALDGTVDASPIYLHGVQIKGAAHDAFFVTTTYGKTIAIDANDGTTLWEFTPSTYSSVAGTYRITTATPVADPDRSAIYAAAPDGVIRKLAIADGHALWSTTITSLAKLVIMVRTKGARAMMTRRKSQKRRLQKRQQSP